MVPGVQVAGPQHRGNGRAGHEYSRPSYSMCGMVDGPNSAILSTEDARRMVTLAALRVQALHGLVNVMLRRRFAICCRVGPQQQGASHGSAAKTQLAIGQVFKRPLYVVGGKRPDRITSTAEPSSV